MIGFGSITISTINAVEETQIYYYQSSSAEDLIDGSWSTTRPTWEDGKYVWQKTVTIYKDGTSSESQPVNITGQQGVGVSSVQRYYKMTDSLPAQPTDETISSWSTTEPQYIAGSTDNIYTVEKIVYADGTTSYSDVSLSASFIAAKQAYELANGVNDKVTSVYGTCSTLESTAKKEVECAGFELYQGARIQVSFNYGNSASTPTLDVNNTGEKNIYLINTIIDSSNQLYWTANAKIDFVYNGTGWVLQNVPVGLYGVCNSNSDTVAKEVICGEAVICKGTYLSVLMNNNNTATAPTLNVASTVACAIKANNSTLTSDSIYNWRANFIQNFIFDGQYWVMCDDIAKYDSSEAKKEATNYLSIDNSGIMVADMSAGQQYLPSNVPTGIKNTFIDNDSFDVRDGQTVLASFGEVAVVGQEANDRMVISPTEIYGAMKNNQDLFRITHYPIGTASGTTISIKNETSSYIPKASDNSFIYTLKRVPKNGTSVSWRIYFYDTDYNELNSYIGSGTYNYTPPSGSSSSGDEEIVIEDEGWYETISEPAAGFESRPQKTVVVTEECFYEHDALTIGVKVSTSTVAYVKFIVSYSSQSANQQEYVYYTFGKRNDDYESGNYSFVEGYSTTASGDYSHAEGVGATASGTTSHAEGKSTKASATSSHAEGEYTQATGLYSHAEGYGTKAIGQSSHAEGGRFYLYESDPQATGRCSHVEGAVTQANGDAAHAEGYDTIALSSYTHTQNIGTRASSAAQTALGKYNIEDTNNEYSVIVGNGMSRTDRSNALAITWGGDTEFALDTTASSGTIDADLYDAITALGWNINDITV